MKFCTKCGAKLVDEAQFCTSCGTACGQPAPQPAAEPELQPAPVAAKEKKPKKPVKKGKVIAILCAVALLIGAAVGGYFAIAWYNSPEQQLLRALKAGQYEQALDIFDEDASLKYSENLSDSLKKRIETIKADYIAATIEYANVMMELDIIAEIDIKGLRELITETRDYVEKLNASRTAFSTVEAFFANADYVEAIAQYKQVIQEDSNYATAVSKANEAVSLYRAKVLADAEVYAATGNYTNAITLLQSALTTLPEDAQVTQQISLYEKAQADQILTNALKEAAQYAAAKDYISAMAVLDQYTKENGENGEVTVAWNTYRDAYVDLVVADAAVYGDAGAYTNAIALLNDALKEFPGNSKLTAQVTVYEKAYREQQLADALARAKAYADSGDYLSAMNVLSTYTADYGSNASVVVALNEYTDKYVDAVLSNAEGEYNAKDYVSAITVLRAGLANVPESAKLSVRLETYSGAYVTEVIAQSDALLAKEDYDGAQDVVLAGLEFLYGNDALLAQFAKIEDIRPKNFVTVCKPYEKRCYNVCTGGKTFMMAGTERGNGFYMDDSGYAYFNLYDDYTQMEFDLGHIDGTDLVTQIVEIYLDGVLYKQYTVESNALPQHIIIPLDGVDQLIIKNVEVWDEPDVGFADVIIK